MKKNLILSIFLLSLISCANDYKVIKSHPINYKNIYTLGPVGAEKVLIKNAKPYKAELNGWIVDKKRVKKSDAIKHIPVFFKSFRKNGKVGLGVVDENDKLLVSPPVYNIKVKAKTRFYVQKVKGGSYFYIDTHEKQIVEMPFKHMQYSSHGTKTLKLYGFECRETCSVYNFTYVGPKYSKYIFRYDNVRLDKTKESYKKGYFPFTKAMVNNESFVLVRHIGKNGEKDYYKMYDWKGKIVLKFRDKFIIDSWSNKYFKKTSKGYYIPFFYPKSNFLGLKIKKSEKNNNGTFSNSGVYRGVVQTAQGEREIIFRRLYDGLSALAYDKEIKKLNKHFINKYEYLENKYIVCQKNKGGTWSLDLIGANLFNCGVTRHIQKTPYQVVALEKKRTQKANRKKNSDSYAYQAKKRRERTNKKTKQNNLYRNRNKGGQYYVDWVLSLTSRKATLGELQKANSLASRRNDKRVLGNMIRYEKMQHRTFRSKSSGTSIGEQAAKNAKAMRRKNVRDYNSGALKNRADVIPKK